MARSSAVLFHTVLLACALGASPGAGDAFAQSLDRGTFQVGRDLGGAARDLAAGLAIDGALVYGLEAGLDRIGTHRQGDTFLSARTATAFTVAPILSSRFGWKVGLPAYGLATVTALGGIEDGPRFPTDVVAGATLGILVGETIARRSTHGWMPGHLTMGRKGVGLRFGF